MNFSWEWVGGISLLLAIASLVLIPWFLTRIPKDYFKKEKPHLLARLRKEPKGKCLVICLKNILGLVLVIVGIAMLVLPGQGLLSVLVGVMLVDFPGKQKIEAKIVQRPKVLKSINWLREKRGREELEV